MSFDEVRLGNTEMKYSIVQLGDSRSFLQGDAFVAGASDTAEVVVCFGAFHRS